MADNYSYIDDARTRQQYSDTSLDSGYTQSLPPTSGGISTAYPVMGGNPAYGSSIGGNQFADTSLDSGFTQSLPLTGGGLASAYSIMGSNDKRSAGYMGANSSPYAQAMQSMQSAYGNQALQRYLGTQAAPSAAAGQSFALAQGSAGAMGGGMSAMGFPNNPTPQMPPLPLSPEFNVGLWGQGPLSWGGEIGGALHHLEGNLGGVPIDSKFGFGDANFGTWQDEDGTMHHGLQGEAGLGFGEIGVPGGDGWLSGEVGTISGGANFNSGGISLGGEAAVAKLSGGVMGHELVKASAGTLEDRAGVWEDDEGWRTGLKAGASLFDMNFFEDVPWLPGVQIEGPKMGGELSVGAGGFSVGAGTNIVGGAATFGDFSEGSDTDSSTRFGLGLGANAGFRLHSTDTDGDNQTEYGFGFDAGPVSFDLKSEDPLRSLANGLMTAPLAVVPPLALAAQTASYLGFENPLLPEGNMTNAAVGAASSAGSALWNAGGAALDAVGGALEGVDTSNFIGSVSDAGSSLWNSATGMVGGLW